MPLPKEIRVCPLFLEMYEKEILRVVNSGVVHAYQVDDLVVKEGDEGDVLYVILDGKLVVRKNTDQGHVDISSLGPGEVFGELILLDDRVRSADVVAMEDCHLLEISYMNIFNFYKKEPQLFGILFLNLSRLLARRLRANNQIIVDLKSGKPAH